jgi:SAM-dependent methyltransferase
MLNLKKSSKNLRIWWDSALGQAFLKSESVAVKKMLPQLFGYHLLVLGEPVFVECVAESPIRHRVWVHPYLGASKISNTLTARHDKLPILSEGVDVVYLAHGLESINNPHEVLRETFRVLTAEGHVIISHFNPWSLWGLWRWCVRFIKRAPWDNHLISVSRLKDWLALLGFDVLGVKTYFFRPPVSHAGTLAHLSGLEKIGRWCWPFLGAGYVVLAKKRILTLTPIRPLFKTRQKLLLPTGIEPARDVSKIMTDV